MVANLIASRLTVLYGPSGVGKSSLLGAAVARSLRELPEKPLVVVHSRWSERPFARARGGRGRSCRRVNGLSALEALEDAQRDRDVYLVLDQAEEYFLYHADDGGPESFAETLPGVLTAPWRINVLVSLREDSLAKPDRFTGRRALRQHAPARPPRPACRAGRHRRPRRALFELAGVDLSVEPELIERVLDEVGAGQIESGLGGSARSRLRRTAPGSRRRTSSSSCSASGRRSARTGRTSFAQRRSSVSVARSTSSRSISRGRWPS